MKNAIVHAALNGEGSYAGKAYFFNANQYVRYDWELDRAENPYPFSNSAWQLPEPFLPGFDAAISGRASYTGKAYFFKNNQYLRYDWQLDKPDANYPQPLSVWNFPDTFASGIDAAINGEGHYEGKAYFFKDNRYIRYDWANDSVDEGYPLSIDAWNFPAPFNTGIDAAINGSGKYLGKAYFFKGNQYLRYDWVSDRVEAVTNIADGWPLLKELLQVGAAKTKALAWISAALIKVKAYKAALLANTSFTDAITNQAFATHFHFTPLTPRSSKLPLLSIIESNYQKVQNVLIHNDSFRGRTFEEARADQGLDDAGNPYPAYTFYNSSINFTQTFGQFGSLCQAAMVLHEPVHYVDILANAANDIYEHSPKYSTIVAATAVHNPSSYVCFAEHVVFGRDERFGAGRPNE